MHAHQPVGNFEDVIEKCYQNAYLPFVQMLEKHPAIRVGLHYSGSLLTWIEKNHSADRSKWLGEDFTSRFWR
jgi:alpha-amylase/alpha-mannosidase (GH57 family)